jgi:hypothetical protein
MVGRQHERARNYTGRKFYVNNKSQKPAGYRTPPNRAALMMLRRNPPHGSAEVRGRKVTPKSGSASFLSKRSTNVWARFPRPKRRQEKAYTKDLAGKKLRTKNFRTKRPDLINPTLNYQKRVATGERPYKGPAAGGYVTRRPGQKAWKGDIAHWPLRGKMPGRRGTPGKHVPGREPGIGAEGIGKYQGNIKAGRKGFGSQGEDYTGNIRARRILKGGGSVSGRVWNNNGSPLPGKTPGRGSSGIGYQGNIKAGRRPFQDQGEGYSGNVKTHGKRGFNDQGEEYAGNIKARRPEKGGGSVSGRVWNNRNSPIAVRVPRGQGNIARYQGTLKAHGRALQDQGEEYTGNIKARRPEKGGGSVSGKLWNNNETPIAGRVPRGQTKIARYQGNMKARNHELQDQGEEYTGNIKARRPEKGGGSVSGKLWNNNETPIAVRVPKNQEAGRFSGNIRVSKSRYKRNPNSPDNAPPVYREKNYQGADFEGNVKLARNSRKRNPNAADEALPGYRERNDQGGDFTGHLKLARNAYKRNPNSSHDALPVLKPTDATARASSYAKGVRRKFDYVRNPSASDEALRTREPGRAFARATDYQGSIKLKRFDLFGKSNLHPDAKFVKLNKNNVPEERDIITNFKLWWARLFKKNDTQPDHLKEKEHKPRYDKGEAGMWYE